MTERQAFFLGGCHPFGNPALEFFDGLATNGELDEMKRHDAGLAGRDDFENDHSFAGAAAVDDAPGAGAS
ncbi:MAG: hypothetical protein ACREDP_14445, partial [Bradyrhizobium sp.]